MSYRTFGPQDVIFAKITPCMENGKCAVVPDIPSGLGYGSTEFHVLRPQPGVNPRFIWHYVRQESFRRLAEDHMTGSVGQLRVPVTFLHDFPIQLPPEAIQKEIVRILDGAMMSAGSASGHLATAQRASKRFRQAVLAAACSGRLTADWRDQHNPEPVDQLLNRIATTRESRRNGAPRTIAAPAGAEELPSSWRWVEFGSVIGELRNGISPAPAMEPPGVPILRISAARPLEVDLAGIRYLREPLDKWAQYRLQDGDLLFTSTTAAWHCWVYVAWCADSMVATYCTPTSS
jgi:type I restriction enzyme, S subunit